jgi:MFS family permease
MFDGLEMGLFPLVARPALSDLLQTTDADQIVRWLAVITATFLIGAATGGVVFGWLGDRIGRVRAMTLSVFTYAVFSGLCGLATEAWQVAALRFIASLGMGGEWSLGVALVMELWPNRSRAWLAGVIGAAANLGYMIIAVVGLGLAAVIGDLGQLLVNLGVSQEYTARLVSNSGWRIMMLFGATPALLTFLIRLFVPESHKWEQEQKTGATNFWQTPDLLGVVIGAAAACGMIALLAADAPWLTWPIRIAGCLIAFAVVLLGYLHPIRRYLHRLGSSRNTDASMVARENRFILNRMLLAAGLSGVALLGTWGTTQQAPTWVSNLPNVKTPDAKTIEALEVSPEEKAQIKAAANKRASDARAFTQMAGAAGAVIGCVLAAFLGDWFGRRQAYCFLCVAACLSIFALFKLNTEYGPTLLVWSFISGMLTASFYGWLPLYLPELFQTRVRATGQGFGFNFGRVLAAIGVMQLPVIMSELKVGFDVACPALSLIYVAGMILIWFAPETKGKPLPEDDGAG